jgi:hypothetical protein
MSTWPSLSEAADVLGEPPCLEETGDAGLLFREEGAQGGREGGGVPLLYPDVVLGVDGAEEVRVRLELDLRDLRESRDEVEDAVPLSDSRRV